jgi:tetratricopeptide (TPR) repeat protein
VRGGAPAALAAAALSACAPALRPLPPSTETPPAPTAAPRRTAADLLAEADALWAERGRDPAAPGRAVTAYRAAAEADRVRTDGLAGAMRAATWMVERTRAQSPDVAEVYLDLALRSGQECQRRSPAAPECDYGLALALGQQARQRPSTARDGLGLMAELLKRAAGRHERLDQGGPHRVLALLLLKAPGWPLGPGDPEAGLEEARRAVAVAPDHAPNQLALAEALDRAGKAAEGREAWGRALALAEAAAAAGEPDAPDWVAEARRGGRQ